MDWARKDQFWNECAAGNVDACIQLLSDQVLSEKSVELEEIVGGGFGIASRNDHPEVLKKMYELFPAILEHGVCRSNAIFPPVQVVNEMQTFTIRWASSFRYVVYAAVAAANAIATSSFDFIIRDMQLLDDQEMHTVQDFLVKQCISVALSSQVSPHLHHCEQMLRLTQAMRPDLNETAIIVADYADVAPRLALHYSNRVNMCSQEDEWNIPSAVRPQGGKKTR